MERTDIEMEQTDNNSTTRVVVATSNANKVAEIMKIINIDGYEFIPLSEFGSFSDPVEDGQTFLDNARIKALAAHQNTGLAAIADDSGIEVDALDGEPGVNSARYSGVHGDDLANNSKLLANMENVRERSKRTARFTCAICYISEDGKEFSALESVEGKIDDHCHGNGGFGYDPLFLPDAYGGELSMAELTMDQKNEISHRGKALRSIREQLLA